MLSEPARRNMVLHQIEGGSVRDDRVLETFCAVPREEFVPAAHRAHAFAEMEIPLPCSQHMMTPRAEAKTLEALAIQPGEEVLEIGTGSGFLAACMIHLGARVDSIEYHAELAASAGAALARLDGAAAHVQQADAWDWAPDRRYDAVVVTGSMPYYDDRFESWVEEGGRVFVVVGEAPAMDAGVVRVPGPGQSYRQSLFDLTLDPLIRDWHPAAGF